MRALAGILCCVLASLTVLSGTARAQGAARPPSQGPGAALFEGACGACHGPGSTRRLQGRPGLERSRLLQDTSPRGALRIVLDGRQPPMGRSGPYMPAFADILRDDDLAALAAYLRAEVAGKPPWPDLSAAVRQARAAK